MKIISTDLKDLFIIQPDVFSDERGYFFESFNEQKFNEKFRNYKSIRNSF